MSIITCKECGKQVSDEAKTCPSCGAQVPKPTGRLKVAFIGAIVIAVCYSIFGEGGTRSPPVERTETVRDKTAAELQEEASERIRSDARMTTAMDTARAIRSAMRDPDSLVIASMNVDPKGDVACVTYRARNGFGGMNGESAVMVDHAIKKASQALWKKNCSGILIDMLWAVK